LLRCSVGSGCSKGWESCIFDPFSVLRIAFLFKVRQQHGPPSEPFSSDWRCCHVLVFEEMTSSPTRLLIFFALTFAWSWTCWLLVPMVNADSNCAASTLFFLGGFGPSLAAVIVVGVTGGWTPLRTWLFNRSAGSVLPVLLLHTASNSWPSFVPILPSDESQRPYLSVVSLMVAAAIWLLWRPDGTQASKGFAL
jgi:hypothetical protein